MATDGEADATYEQGALRLRSRWGIGLVALVLVALGVGIGVGANAVMGNDTPAAPRPALVGNLRQAIHEHADFALFIRGERFDFGQAQFVSDDKQELSPNVHVHHPRHTVLHVHREATTWEEFFRSVGFEIKDSTNLGEVGQERMVLPSGEVLQPQAGEKFTFVVNGVRVDGIAGMNISALDRVLISFGGDDAAAIDAQWAEVTDESCIPQGVCLERGNGAGEHGEPCATNDGTCTGT
ncbi:MAG: hypothetical protein M0R74_00660 [Dehalococcoidia bacterium]|nr:hypothetical protein [Dehalococcoidia bacterium]